MRPLEVVPPEGLKNNPSENCIATFRDMLARAERGEVIACAVATIRNDGTPSTEWANDRSTVTNLIGATSLMHGRLLKFLLDP